MVFVRSRTERHRGGPRKEGRWKKEMREGKRKVAESLLLVDGRRKRRERGLCVVPVYVQEEEEVKKQR